MILESIERLADIETPSNPFPGLRPFEFHESYLFFGREGQSERLIEKLSRARFLAVVGASGSGKSSLVRAELLPDLYSGMMKDAGSAWRVALMRPGNDPIGNLARALNSPDAFGADDEENRNLQIAITEATLRRGNLGLVEAVRQTAMPPTESLIVIADQFEELFRVEQGAKSAASNEEKANDKAAFVKLLLEAASQRELYIYVVLTMRSDYLGDCAQFQDLPEAINEGQYLIPRMTREQRSHAITRPVAVGGAEITLPLVNRLLNDVGDNPDQLPILQHALMRTWDEWKREQESARSGERESGIDNPKSFPIDLRHYEAIGGMAEALSLHADEAYGELPDERGQRIAERMFKLLTEKGADNREIRRPATLGDICAVAEASEDEVIAVIEKFRARGSSFLTPPAETGLNSESLIDISHESLIRNWKRLSRLVDEETRSARLYFRLAETAALHREGKAGLWRDPDLQIALDWRERNRPNESWARRYFAELSLAMSFLEQSRQAHEAETQRVAAEALEKEERSKRELRQAKRFVIAISITLFCVLTLTLIAFLQRNKALKNERKVRRLAYSSSLVLAQKALEEGNYTKGNNILHDHLPSKGIFEEEDLREFYWYYLWRLYNNQKAKLKGHSRDVTSVVFSPDGNTLASGSEDGTARLWSARDGQALAVLTVESDTILGGSVAFSPDGATLATGGERIRLWDVASRKEIGSLETRGRNDPIAFSPNGGKLASGGSDSSIILWDLKSRQAVMTLRRHRENITAIAFSPDGNILASGSRDKTINLWEVKNGRHLTELSVGDDVSSVAFSPDGKMLANGSWGNGIILWNIISRQKMAALESGSGYVASVVFSPDGKRLVSAHWDDVVKIWDLLSKQELGSLRGHADDVTSVAVSPDGKTIASGSSDHTVRLWDAKNVEEVTILSGHIGLARSVAFSHDGKLLASGGKDNSVRLWNWQGGQELVTLKGHQDAVGEVKFSPDGKMLASGCKDGTVKIWDLGDMREARTLKGHTDSVNSIAFSLDGSILASGSSDETIRLWDVKTGAQLAKLEGHKNDVNCVAFSPDGRTLASGGGRDIGLWSVSSKKTVSIINTRGAIITSMAFSSDGKMLATSHLDGTRLIDIDSEREILTFKGHTDYVFDVAFSSDGKTLASAGADKTVKLWDAQSGQEIATLKGYRGIVHSVAFSPSGKVLASASEGGEVRLWVAATDEEVEQQRNR